MPSPDKADRDRASRSLAALKPKLKRRPVSVSPSGRQDLSRDRSRERPYGGAQQLKQMLQQHNPQPPNQHGYIPHAPQRSIVKQLPNIEESVGIIQHQSAYIRQLESELKLSQGELATYKIHLHEVLEENARITSSQQTSAIIKDVLAQTQATKTSQPITKQSLSKHMTDLELLKNLHSSKAEIVELHLASTKEALHAAEQKIDELRSRLLIQDSLSTHDADGMRKHAGVCVKCGRREAVIAAQYDQSSTIQQLAQEKEDLIETLANIKRQLVDMQERELQAVQKVKVGIEITEQANIDKTQALIQKEQMHEELSSLKERYETVLSNHSTALHNTKNSAREEVKNEVTEIERRLRQATDSESSLKAQFEKLTREKEDLTSELKQNRSELSIYQSSMVESTTGRKVDMTQLACERDMAVDERNKVKNRLFKVEQVKEEAVLRVKQELEDVRLRLDKAERELLLAKEEAVKLTKNNQDLDKQLHQVKMAYNSVDRSRNDELTSLTRKLEGREEELQRIITETEARYGKQLLELENMYVAQNKLVEQLRAECTVQADTIQNMSSKYRTENKHLRHDNQTLSRQLDKCRDRLKALEKHQVDHEKIHKKLRDRVTQLDEENRTLARQTNEMTARCSEYNRDKDLLDGELQMLRCQVKSGQELSGSPNRMNAGVVDNLLDALKSEMVSQDANITGSIAILRESDLQSEH